MRRGFWLALAALLALLTSTAVLSAASAQEAPLLTVRQVDATDASAVSVTFTYQGDRNDLRNLVVREGDRTVEATAPVPLADQTGLGIVLVIDASGSMAKGALIERVLEAAHQFVEGKAAQDQIAIVTFNSEARVVQEFTADEAVLGAAIDDIALGPDTALYDGIVRSAALLEDTNLQPNLIVFSDGADTVSTLTAERALASVENAGAALFAIGVENPGFKVLEDMARASGGASAVAGDPAGVGALFESLQASLRRQYVVTYTSKATGGAVPLTLSVGNQQARAEFAAGSAADGASALRPQVVEKPTGPFGLPAPGFLRDGAGLWLAVLLAALAVGVAALSVGLSFFGREQGLNSALLPYSEGYVADDEFDVDDGGDGKAQQLAQSPMLQRAVAATGQFADRQGFLTKIEGQLERANLPLRPPEAIFFYFAGVVVIALLLVALSRSVILVLGGTALAAAVPPAVLSTLARRRQKQFDSLLPDTLQLLASTLRAGYSLMQGVEAVSQEVSEPVGRELRRVVTEARLGRPLEESLDGVAERMDSGDFAWAVMAIRIQREVGGNLAELLVTVAETMTERERLRRDVNALTAEGKISAIVLTILPVGLGVFIYSVNPGYMDPLFDETIGRILLGGALGLMLFGFWWMKKTIEIDI
ncbi:MAG: type II secretion system F family protein [Microthrixaceae bacterium]